VRFAEDGSLLEFSMAVEHLEAEAATEGVDSLFVFVSVNPSPLTSTDAHSLIHHWSRTIQASPGSEARPWDSVAAAYAVGLFGVRWPPSKVNGSNVLADVTLPRQKRLAGVQPHSDPDQTGLERHIRRRASSKCRPRIGEHVERITPRVNLDTTLGGEDLAKHSPMLWTASGHCPHGTQGEWVRAIRVAVRSTRPWRLTPADDTLIGLPVDQRERRSRQGRLSSRYRSAQRQIERPGAHSPDGERLESWWREVNRCLPSVLESIRFADVLG
jgi:hypothetical protein